MLKFSNILVGLTFLLLSCSSSNDEVAEVKSIDKFKNATLQAFTNVENKVSITGGEYIPLYGSEDKKVSVGDFEMDVYPVTNADFLAFVIANPQWQKSNVKKIFADASYLKTWKDDTTLGENMSGDSPVTNISWYAARAYAKALGCRLPTLAEWEYVAMADEVSKDARKKEGYNQSILNWYEKRHTHMNSIGNTSKNAWGLYDVHGLVWEWVDDFNSVLLGSESRGNEGGNKDLFCASSSIGANDLMNYAAFMRYAFRGSLEANYNMQNLGFRTVKDKNLK